MPIQHAKLFKVLEEHINELDAFLLGDGDIDKEELKRALPANLNIPDAKIDSLFKWMDADGSGSCSKAEFEETLRAGSACFTKKLLLQNALKKMFVIIFLGLPVVSIIIAAIFGAMLAGIEGWDFEPSFYITLADITATSSVQVANVPAPDTTMGKLLGCGIGLVSLAVVGALIGLMGGPLLEPFIDLLHLDVSEKAKERGHGLREALGKMCLLVFVGIPVAAVIISAIFGFVLAEVEGGSAKGWPYSVGFYAVLSELSGTNLAVVSAPAIESHGGKLMACLIGVWSLCILSCVVGVMGGPLIEPIIVALRAEPEAHQVNYGSRMRKPRQRIAPTTDIDTDIPIASPPGPSTSPLGSTASRAASSA
jgi:hypothetical protein